MPIDFHHPKNRNTYATRVADSGWGDAIECLVSAGDRVVVDIGCGGGIYSRAWLQLGASRVIGIDSSQVMLQDARHYNATMENVVFREGDACATGLEDELADIVFIRAVIHHLDNLPACFAECRRILKPGGVLLIQDRTPEDVQMPASTTHIRGYFFEIFPHLLSTEMSRRPTADVVEHTLSACGYQEVTHHTLWETRRTYNSCAELEEDLQNRTGRSILHELNDAELTELVAYIGEKLPNGEKITEQDRWSLWTAVKRS